MQAGVCVDDRGPSLRSVTRKSVDLAEHEFRLAITAKDARTSEAHLRKSLAHHPTSPAWNNLGLLQLQDGRRRDAEDSFNRALAVEPGYEPAKRNLDKVKVAYQGV